MSSWYKSENIGIAVSTRIRIARNVKGIPFPRRMNEGQKNDFLKVIKELTDGVSLKEVGALKFFNVADLPEEELSAMVERHIISPDFLKKQGPRGLVLSEDETLSIMLLEEDHIRIQVILGGLEPNKAYEIALEAENLLSGHLDIAFDDKLGYLTECPTNLGTGLRASVMLHLPILEATGQVAALSDSVSKIGLTVRGMYGEKSRSYGGLYQLSNQVTLGISEKDATENLRAITTQIIKREKAAREGAERVGLEDSIFRALGTLKYARKLSSEEMIKLISRLMLGTEEGIVPFVDSSLAFSLLTETLPASLQKSYGIMTPEDRDIKRAEVIRERLG